MLLNALLLALHEIRRNLMRSFLTVLGIVIGVAAVITMVTLGNGATQMVATQIASLGSNLLMVMPGQRLGPGRDSAGAPKFRIADVEAIQQQIGGLKAVAPVVGSSVTLVAGTQNWSSTVNGTTNDYLISGNWKLAAGRPFSDDEERAGKAVCIIGNTVKRELFGNQSPLGNSIRVKTFDCEVIGLLAAKGQGGMGQDQDDTVLMPLKTVQRRLTGTLDIGGIMVSLKDTADSAIAMTQLRSLLRERRKLADNVDDNFNVMDTRQIAETLSGTIGTMTALLGAVAAVSLLVGGIGIMNIMLVSVTERTREIGIRMAIGARGRDILTQFLVEAMVLSSIGGVAGILLGSAGAHAVSRFAGWEPLVSTTAVVVAVLFSAGVGILFGLYPAWKASRLDPIEALRFE